MATKITKVTASGSSESSASKGAAEPSAKVETSEEMRRRRAGIACFL